MKTYVVIRQRMAIGGKIVVQEKLKRKRMNFDDLVQDSEEERIHPARQYS